ncbi:MAG: hypothetical protein WEC59_03095 [Salibacteraceae bacterium]
MKKLVFLFFTLSFSACQQGENGSSSEIADTDITTPENWQRYEMGNYSIAAPDGWELDQSGRMNTTFILFAPYDSVESYFKENVNLVTEDISESGVSLDDYAQNAHDLLGQYMEGLANFESRKEGENRIWFTYEGEQQTMKLYFNQMLTIQDSVVHILTFTSNADTTENARIAEEVIASFQFSN